MNLNFCKKIKILTDFRSNLKMFNLDKNKIQEIKKKFKNIEFEFVDLNKMKKKYNADIYWGTRINDDIFKRCTNLKWIHFGSVGIDKLDYDNTDLKKILVSNSKSINSDAVFNLILYFLIDTSRKILKGKNLNNRITYEKIYKKCKDLSDQKICVLGYGNISKKLQRFSDLYKLDIKFLSQRNIKKIDVINEREFLNNIKNYDTIINLLKFNSKNNNFLNKKIFDKMKKNINLILVGRLKTIDLSSLSFFLKKNKNAMCYMDGILEEPKLNKIKNYKNIFITPHIGGYFKNYWIKQISIFEVNLKLFLSKKKLKNLVN